MEICSRNGKVVTQVQTPESRQKNSPNTTINLELGLYVFGRTRLKICIREVDVAIPTMYTCVHKSANMCTCVRDTRVAAMSGRRATICNYCHRINTKKTPLSPYIDPSIPSHEFFIRDPDSSRGGILI